jgi:hypothetical protein
MGNTHDIASLIFETPISIFRDTKFMLSDEEEYFFFSEFSFYLFFLMAGNCMADNLCEKDFLMDIENKLANLFVKTIGNTAEDYKEIIRNRFSSYKSTKSNTNEERSLERENIFLYILKNDTEKNGFCLVNIPKSILVTPSNALHRTYYKLAMIEILKTFDILIKKIKLNNS